MQNKPKCQANQKCKNDASLLAWGRWVCGGCYSNKINELNNSVWGD